jgi:prepilin-type processing-associated H-X9-DG protein
MNSYFGWLAPVTQGPSTPGGPISIVSFNSSKKVMFDKTSDLTSADPTKIFLFSDMNPASVCHAGFVVAPMWFYHYPFVGHDRSGVLTFADGHVEAHKWTDPKTLNPGFDLSNHFQGSTDNSDFVWLMDRASVDKASPSTSFGQ